MTCGWFSDPGLVEVVRSLVVTKMMDEWDYIIAFSEIASGESPSTVAYRYRLPKDALASRFTRLAKKVRYRDMMIKKVLDEVIPVLLALVPDAIEHLGKGIYMCRFCGAKGSKTALRPHLLRSHRDIVDRAVDDVIEMVEDNLRWWDKLRSAPSNVEFAKDFLTDWGKVNSSASP